MQCVTSSKLFFLKKMNKQRELMHKIFYETNASICFLMQSRRHWTSPGPSKAVKDPKEFK